MSPKLFVAIVTITLGFATTGLSQERVSVRDLITKPQRWNGKTISVTGYYDSGGHSTFIAQDNRAATINQEENPTIFVDLPNKIRKKAVTKALHHFVQIVGIFQYRELTKKEIPIPPGRDPTARTFIETTIGFGWMGIYDKQITDITKFESISARER